MQEEATASSLQTLVNWMPIHFGEKNGDETTQFFRTQDERTGQYVFVKKINLSKDFFNEYQAEVNALTSLNNENIIPLIENGTESLANGNSFQSFGYIIIPYIGDLDLCDALSNYKWKVDENDLVDFAYNLIVAVNHIHSSGIIHRDLKLENIVLDHYTINNQTGQFSFNPDSFTIIDFGSSYSFIDHFYDEDNRSLTNFKRTQKYSSPEFINENILTEKYDIFSCGIILYSIVAGHYPKFNYVLNDYGIYTQFLQYDIDALFDKNEWVHVSDEMKNMIKSMLSYDPLFRPTANHLLKLNVFQTQLPAFSLSEDDETLY